MAALKPSPTALACRDIASATAWAAALVAHRRSDCLRFKEAMAKGKSGGPHPCGAFTCDCAAMARAAAGAALRAAAGLLRDRPARRGAHADEVRAGAIAQVADRLTALAAEVEAYVPYVREGA